MIRTNDPASVRTRLGNAILWPIAMLRFSLGNCSQDTMTGMDTSAVVVVGTDWGRGNVEMDINIILV